MKFVRFTLVVPFLLLNCYTSSSNQQGIATEGTLVVLNKNADTVNLISLKDGKIKATIPIGTEPHEAAVSPDGKLAVACNTGYRANGNSLSVIDVKKKEVIKVIDLGSNRNPHGITYLPDGERIVTTTEGSRTITVVNIKKGVVEKSISTGNLPCHMVEVTPDGKLAFATSIQAGTLVIVDLEKGEVVKSLYSGNGAEGFDISPDGKEVWVGNRGEDTISIIDVESFEIKEKISSKGFPIRLKFTPNGKYALVSNMNAGEVAAFDYKSRKMLHQVSMEVQPKEGSNINIAVGNTPAPIGLLVSPDNKFAFVATSRADIVTVIDLQKWEIADRFPTGNYPDGMAFSKQVIK